LCMVLKPVLSQQAATWIGTRYAWYA
jgi:hypothetical protein